mmetsp:Transcript_7409/g.11227  ORF Transcript_7409/g.11227 Transcript_7409/m.11227 type:complete len:378 (-) Transcript_7409:127-1260(-)
MFSENIVCVGRIYNGFSELRHPPKYKRISVNYYGSLYSTKAESSSSSESSKNGSPQSSSSNDSNDITLVELGKAANRKIEHLKQNDVKPQQCDCESTKTYCATYQCYNKATKIECDKTCPCGQLCQNQRLRKKIRVPHQLRYTGAKGWGFFCTEKIWAGEIIGEYCGEIVSDVEKERRLMKDYAEHHDFYLLDLNKFETIDATTMGAPTRFINHSCEPNARTEKWAVDGKLRVGIFAQKDISAGSEITFDYKFQRRGKGDQKCYCGAKNCRGTLGGKPVKATKSEEAESKDEIMDYDEIISKEDEEKLIFRVLENKQECARLQGKTSDCEGEILPTMLRRNKNLSTFRQISTYLDNGGDKLDWALLKLKEEKSEKKS